MPIAYCGECEWQYRVDGVDGDDPGELSRAMINHFVETGHSPVERCDAEERLEERADTDDRASEKRSVRPPESVSDRDSNPRLE